MRFFGIFDGFLYKIKMIVNQCEKKLLWNTVCVCACVFFRFFIAHLCCNGRDRLVLDSAAISDGEAVLARCTVGKNKVSVDGVWQPLSPCVIKSNSLSPCLNPRPPAKPPTTAISPGPCVPFNHVHALIYCGQGSLHMQRGGGGRRQCKTENER